MLTQERLRELLDYDPETGLFILKVSRGGRFKGAVAGCISDHGYRLISVDNVLLQGSRLAWLYVHGYWPKMIDHINRVRSDDRIANLRECSRAENTVNSKLRRTNTSGARGVYWNKARGHWFSKIKCNDTIHYLGVFPDVATASAAYVVKARELFGAFAEETAR